jgi:hypothetical protein
MLQVDLDPCTVNSRKVLAGLDLIGLPYELRRVDYFSGAHKKPEFLAINPNGAVPAVVDGDFALSESNAILQYAADLISSDKHYPKDLKQRADINRWLLWEASTWFPSCYRPEARRCGDDDQPSRGAPSWLEARLKHSGGVDGVQHGYSLWHEHLEPGGLRRDGAQPHSTPNGPGWRPSVYRPDVRRDGFGISRTFCWRLVKLVDAMKLPCDTSAGCGVFLTHSQPGGNYEKRRNPCRGVRA